MINCFISEEGGEFSPVGGSFGSGEFSPRGKKNDPAIGLFDRLATCEFAPFCSDCAASPAGAVSDFLGLFG